MDLEVLIDAFILLKKMNGHEDVQTCCLPVVILADDTKFIKAQKRKISAAGLSDSVEFIDDFEGDTRKIF
jgi:hypothetical protein